MEKPILSIIVPSYNVSKYVDEVLPFYIEEDLLGRIKVIFIDDGATDDSAQKINEYVKKHPETLQFYHKENGGHGSVINCAIEKVISTKYFKVIDGDDWVYPGELLKLINYLEHSDDDLVITNCSYEYKNHQTISYGIRPESGDLNLRIHNVTYKTSIFTDNNIRVREKVFYEDSQFVLYPLEYVRSYSYLPVVAVRYRQDEPTQSVNPDVQLKRKNQYELVLEDLLQFYSKIENNHEMLEIMKEFCLKSITRIMFGSFELNWSYQRKVRDAIKDSRRINKLYKGTAIYKNLRKTYKRFRQMSLLNFNGIRFARMVHKSK